MKTIRTNGPTGFYAWLMIGASAAGLLIPVSAWAQCWGTKADEIKLLAPLLELKSGSVVAEIGAGNGGVAIAAAKWVGPTGHVYATEIDPKRITRIHDRISASGLHNVSVIEAAADSTKLPVRCCDAIYMIGVYHHLTEPLKTDASILQALRPGGRLVVVDFRPSLWLKPWTPTGIPANRGGHGIPDGILQDELRRTGFQITKIYHQWGHSWFLSNYCVVASKQLTQTSAER
jgi:ubiquinone/menaquinone biosynthesis C-methylase UbiE